MTASSPASIPPGPKPSPADRRNPRWLRRMLIAPPVTLVGLVVLAILGLGGSVADPLFDVGLPEVLRARGGDIWEHGWPWPFLERVTATDTSHRFAWNGQVQRFSSNALVLDLFVIGLAGVAWGVIAWQGTAFRWRRCRPWRFSLVSVLVVMVVVGLAARSFVVWKSYGRDQKAIAERFKAEGHVPMMTAVTPVWLARLAGGPVHAASVPAVCWLSLRPIPSGTFRNERPRSVSRLTSPESADALAESAARRSRLERLAADLARCDRLTDLLLMDQDFNDAEFERLMRSRDRWPIHILVVQNSPELQGDSLREIGRFSELRHLSLSYTAVDDAGVAHLAACPNVRYLNLNGTAITPACVPHLLALPNLERLDACADGISREDLAVLIDRGTKCRAHPASMNLSSP